MKRTIEGYTDQPFSDNLKKIGNHIADIINEYSTYSRRYTKCYKGDKGSAVKFINVKYNINAIVTKIYDKYGSGVIVKAYKHYMYKSYTIITYIPKYKRINRLMTENEKIAEDNDYNIKCPACGGIVNDKTLWCLDCDAPVNKFVNYSLN